MAKVYKRHSLPDFKCFDGWETCEHSKATHLAIYRDMNGLPYDSAHEPVEMNDNEAIGQIMRYWYGGHNNLTERVTVLAVRRSNENAEALRRVEAAERELAEARRELEKNG